jgi:hypothetical protein
LPCVPKVIPAPLDILGCGFNLRVKHNNIVCVCPLVVSRIKDKVITFLCSHSAAMESNMYYALTHLTRFWDINITKIVKTRELEFIISLKEFLLVKFKKFALLLPIIVL